ncbi:unnamed protein product [Closterium sp. Naga37s-1]|nr:unnamed protein product [Closterium sp. Naga37s-1]CAI5536612.1 unnamed protein product [Closterium sp. Naga37s-1]
MECEQQGAAVAATGKGTAEMGAAARGAAASATTGGNMGGAAPCTHLLHPPAALPPPLVPPPAAPAFSPRDPPQQARTASSPRLASPHPYYFDLNIIAAPPIPSCLLLPACHPAVKHSMAREWQQQQYQQGTTSTGESTEPFSCGAFLVPLLSFSSELYVPSTLAPFPSASSRRLLSSHTLLRRCLTSRHVNGGMGGITGEVKSFDFFLWIGLAFPHILSLPLAAVPLPIPPSATHLPLHPTSLCDLPTHVTHQQPPA